MANSPTTRSLAYARKHGYTACVVEKWVAQARKRIDAFNFGDVLAVNGDLRDGALLIQACATSSAAARRHKIIHECTKNAYAWLHANNQIEVYGWAKRGKAGKRKLWTLARWSIELVGEGPRGGEEYIETVQDGLEFVVTRLRDEH